jgi:hypothetical protein
MSLKGELAGKPTESRMSIPMLQTLTEEDKLHLLKVDAGKKLAIVLVK